VTLEGKNLNIRCCKADLKCKTDLLCRRRKVSLVVKKFLMKVWCRKHFICEEIKIVLFLTYVSLLQEKRLIEWQLSRTDLKSYYKFLQT
jgi:hypothetical protein